ncbi:MAG: hypothetical protein V7L29_26615 [Nostoc sp.]|uniref:hypothetical protein n=1 Tax=Nostoc sp. TaxID=1180 RepID=UPI002FF8BAC9
MTEQNESNQDRILDKKQESSDQTVDYDWRDSSKPCNPEDDVIVDGWRRRADGTFEKIEDTEAKQ